MGSRDAFLRDDVVDARTYDRLRPRYRELVARILAARRVRLGESALVLFENRETVLWQIHEVLPSLTASPRETGPPAARRCVPRSTWAWPARGGP